MSSSSIETNDFKINNIQSKKFSFNWFHWLLHRKFSNLKSSRKFDSIVFPNRLKWKDRFKQVKAQRRLFTFGFWSSESIGADVTHYTRFRQTTPTIHCDGGIRISNLFARWCISTYLNVFHILTPVHVCICAKTRWYARKHKRIKFKFYLERRVTHTHVRCLLKFQMCVLLYVYTYLVYVVELIRMCCAYVRLCGWRRYINVCSRISNKKPCVV